MTAQPGPHFTAVAGDVAGSVVEDVHRQLAVVAAAAAPAMLDLHIEVIQLVQPQDGAAAAFFIAFQGDECRAEGPHEAGDIRTHHILFRNLFKGPQHRVVVEGPSLNDDVFPQVLGIVDLDDLLKGILDDRVGQTGGDIADGSPFLLGLLDLGVHEHRAAGTQIHGILGFQSRFDEGVHVQAQGFGESFQKRTTPRGAGFIQNDAVDGAAPDPHALHVLSADVQDEIHLGFEIFGPFKMGHGFNFTDIHLQGGLNQAFTVAGNRRVADVRILGQQAVNIP